MPSATRKQMHKPDELRELAESYLGDLALTPELHGQAESVRYALTMGGKRVRPVICLATAEAAGAEPVHALPAAAAVELGLLFQIVDDILDSDGYVFTHGVDGARALADEAAERAQTRLDDVPADTSVLSEIVAGLAARTS